MKKNNYKAALFDMDGVLVDNNEFHYKSFEVFCEKYKLAISPEIYNTHITGRTNEKILSYYFGENLSPERIQELTEEKEAIYRELYKPHIEAMKGLPEFMEYLKAQGVPCAVASNGPMVNIDFVLEHTGLKAYFISIVNVSMVKQGKPAPDLYLLAASQCGTAPEDCIVFEDSPTGIKAGLEAGIEVMGLTTTHKPEELAGVSGLIKDFSDALLYKLF